MKNASFFRGLLLLCYFLVSDQSFAIIHSDLVFSQQQTQITGIVKVDGMPMTGVSISVLGKQATAISDEDGKFSIIAEPTDTLVFSFVGFKTVTEPLNGRTSINIQMQEDATSLQEVTVNAGYYTVKEKERTGSIAKIKAADIEKQPVSNPLAAMQGRMSGVNITQSTGTPGGGFSIQIRGLNSIRGEGNDPMYIIDGVPYASQSLGGSSLTNGVLPSLPSPLNSINPSDIESIEVLKDADATAIYGSRGANGVVLITTKKGKAGETKFTVQAATTIGQAVSNLDVMNTQQYLAMREEAFVNDGITEYPPDAYDVNGTWSQTRNTDWKKELFGKTSYVHNVQAGISGGSADTQFIVNGTYRTESTVTPDDGLYRKGALYSNITHKSSDDRFHLNFSGSYTSDKNTLPGLDLSRYAYTLAPNAPSLYDVAGNLNWENGTFENPLGQMQSRYLSQTNNFISNAVLSYKIYRGLTAKASAGFNDVRFTENKTFPHTMYNPLYNVTTEYSAVMNNNASRRSWIFEPQLGWNGSFGRAKLDILAGATFQSQKQNAFSLYAMGFASDALLQNIAAANTLTILNDDAGQYKYNAFFGRVNISLKERYILNLTGRRDGSSRFGTGNRFANFGALGVAWIFSKENFLIQNTILSFGKIRGSYGITGNDQIGDYQYLNTYSVTPNLYDGITGLQPTRLFNPDFGWETNKKLEGAVELGFFRDRIFLSAAAFQNRSSNQLVGVPLPGTTGFPVVQSNLDATVQNTGLEIDLRTANVQQKDFKWTTSLNFTKVSNKLLEYPDLDGSVYANTFIVGQSISIKRLYHYTGIDPESGTYVFEDVNGDGRLTSDDRSVIVDFTPEYYGGIGNNITYKNWNLDFLFQFVKQQAFRENVYFPTGGIFSNQPVSVLNHYPAGNDAATTQQYTAGANGDAWTAQDYYTQSNAVVTDASYVRLKSLSLAYTIPTSWSKTFSGKVYLQGQNLLTFTKYDGVDPETQSIYYLPPLRQITLGLQLGF
jgi:TonB-linked SusC/RagA family outer membrane protein